MNRLQVELRRLYGVGESAPVGADGRAAVLELARPADWPALAAVWRGVQAELGLPAPAIEINGVDGYRLWFALAEPAPAADTAAFLAALRRRYLGDVAPARATQPAVDAAMVPPRQLAADRWSAFVAPDLAPVFADEPWLDTPPGLDGQADLLLRHAAINAVDWRVALERLGAAAPEQAADTPPRTAGANGDPRAFLLGVMNDAGVALPLRVEAAKALLLAEPQRR